MTLPKAIEHCLEKAKQDCSDCGKEHPQLAKWLQELEEYKQLEKQGLIVKKTFEKGNKAYIHQFDRYGILHPVESTIINVSKKYITILLKDGRKLDIPKNSKGIFLTEELAISSLKKMKEGVT